MKSVKRYSKIFLITIICLIVVISFGTINSYAGDENPDNGGENPDSSGLSITSIFEKGKGFIDARKK